MTNVLVITNKRDLTSDFIIKELVKRNISFYRFNTEELSKSCFVTLDFSKNNFFLSDVNKRQEFNLKDFTSVYYRRPELPTINSTDLSEGEVVFLKNEFYYTLEGIYKILRDSYWISPVYAIREAENKIYQLEMAKSIGFVIPESIITNTFLNCIDFYDKNSGNCIIKPVKTGLIEEHLGSKVIFTSYLKKRPVSKDQVEFSPVFLQTLIKKRSDIRVTLVGDKIFATAINSQANIDTMVDWRKGEMILEHSKIELPIEITEKCISLLKILNLRFGAIDFILDEQGKFIFLEINPNGQWAWIQKQTDYNISNEIVNLLENETF